jgi:hypothetical protein
MGEPGFPPQRTTALESIWGDPNYVADQAGAGGSWQKDTSGSVFTVSVITKLAMLGILKFSTLDPQGMGVEMEGGKPGWNDAMNGLPGIIGSGMPETYEMLRLLTFVRKAVSKNGRDVSFPSEFADFLTDMEAALSAYTSSTPDVATAGQSEFDYWDASNLAREKYRLAVVGFFSGKKLSMPSSQLVDLLLAMEKKTEQGIARALATNNGFSPTYFYYECVEYDMLVPEPTIPGNPPPPTKVRVKAFKLHTLPLFLEGPTRQFKVTCDDEVRKEIKPLIRQGFENVYCQRILDWNVSGHRSYDGFLSRLAGEPISLASYELQILFRATASRIIYRVL